MGKYKGLKINQAPNSYLRWMLSQEFPEEWMEIAREKLAASHFDSTSSIEVSRHALDMFSVRFIDKWNEREDKKIGIATFLAHLADEAVKNGKDITKKRRSDEGQIFDYKGIKFVVTPNEPLKTVITVM